MKMWIFCAFLHTSYALQLRVKNSVTTRWQQTFTYADPTQSRSCQRAGIVNNEKIKFLIQNRPTTVAKNRRRSWKSGTQLTQAETDFFSFSSPFNNLGADMPAWLSDFVIFFFLSSFSIHSSVPGGKHESWWLRVVCRSLHLPPPPSWWCLFLPHLFHDVHWK